MRGDEAGVICDIILAWRTRNPFSTVYPTLSSCGRRGVLHRPHGGTLSLISTHQMTTRTDRHDLRCYSSARNRYGKKNGGTINAVECNGCTIKTDGVNVAVLGLKNLKIGVSRSEVRVSVRKRSIA